MTKTTSLNLQLFAGVTAAAGTATEPENTNSQTKEPGTGQEPDGKADDKANDKKDKSEKVFSHADFDRLFAQKYAELESKKQKELDEAKRLAQMSAEEKANHKAAQEKERADSVQKELDEYKRKDALNEMSKTARKMLADEGINISDELLSVIVTTEAETTQANVKNFAKIFKAEVEKGVKAQATGTTPKNIQNNSNGLSELEKRIAKYN